MALKKCYECGKEISTSVQTCPHCGARQHKQIKRTRMSTGCLVFIAITIIIALWAIFSDNNSKTPSRKRSPETQRVISTKTPKEDSDYTALKAAVSCDRSQFVITNNDTFDWKNVKLEVNAGLIRGGYNLKIPVLRAGRVYTVGVMQFAKSDGTRLNPMIIKVQKMDIFCDIPGSRQGYWFGAWK